MIIAPDTSPSEETSPRYAGWRVVFACFLMALFLFGFGLYGHGVYLAELQRLNGWPAALISGASTLSFLLANTFATFTSELVARLGPRRLVLLGIAALAASMTLLAWATAPWQVYVAFILMSLGWIGMGVVVIATVVSLWFVRRRGLAISLALTGASSGGVVVTPLLVLLVERFGFATAMLTAVMVAVLVPALLPGSARRQPPVRPRRWPMIVRKLEFRPPRTRYRVRSCCAAWRSGPYRYRLRLPCWLRLVSSCTRLRCLNRRSAVPARGLPFQS
jgi:MFS family permease